MTRWICRKSLSPLVTKRLLLRPFDEDDFEAYAAYHSLPEVYRYLYAAVPIGEVLKQKFSDMLDAPFTSDGDVFRLAVVLGDDKTLIGQVSLKIASKAARQGEVGYTFNPSFAGKGYATEAAAAIIDAGFSGFGFHRIFARLDAANKGSVGVVERLGLRREAHLKQNDQFDGVWGDEYIYAVLRLGMAGVEPPLPLIRSEFSDLRADLSGPLSHLSEADYLDEGIYPIILIYKELQSPCHHRLVLHWQVSRP